MAIAVPALQGRPLIGGSMLLVLIACCVTGFFLGHAIARYLGVA